MKSDLWGLGAYAGDIAPPSVPTETSFYIRAFDTTGNHTDSPTYSLLMDAAPQITLSGLPASTKGDFILTAEVFEPDGRDTIDNSSVVAYYRFSTETVWQSKSMPYLIII